MSRFESTQLQSSPDREDRSQFTYHDLKNLSRFSTTCPLRVIALVDFDAFYAQCEIVRLGLPPECPLAVQQWNMIIALNYAAKAAGLKRIVSPDEAKLKCPDIVIQHVATWREGDSSWAYRDDVTQHMKTDKAALDPYRKQSRKAFELIKSVLPSLPVQRVEKASVDEVFLDLSYQVYGMILERFPHLSSGLKEDDLNVKMPLPPTTLLDWCEDKVIGGEAEVEVSPPDWDDIALNLGSEIVRSVRRQIFEQLKYTCSAGIARNKTLAKLAAGHNKPNMQTVVRARAISVFLSHYEFTKIRGLGGKLGQRAVDVFGTKRISELLNVSIEEMRSKLGAESGTWLFNVIRGTEHSEVVERTLLQSMLAAKTFIPKAEGLDQAEKWLRIFAGDLMGRLEEQDAASTHRRPRVIALHHSIEGRFGPTRSKQMQIPLGAQISSQLLFDLSRTLLIQVSHDGPTWPCLGLSVSVSHFEDTSSGNRNLTSFFSTKPQHAVDNFQDPQTPYKQQREDSSSNTLKRKRGLLDFNGFDRSPSTRKTSHLSLIHAQSEPTMPTTQNHQTAQTLRSPTALSNENMYSCPKCEQHIANADVLEHLDWHFAMELQDA